MNKAHIKILLYAILLFGSLSSCNSERHRHILVVHSYDPNYAGYPEFNERIKNEFSKRGIQARLKFFYLNCENARSQKEVSLLTNLLDTIGYWKPEVILVNEDQATYSLLATRHPLLKSTPIVFAGVNYPNWELIKQYNTVTGFHDKIDFVRNFEIIRRLSDNYAEVSAILDSTFLDRKLRADLKKQVKGQKISITSGTGYNQKSKDSLKDAGYIVFDEIRVRTSPYGNNSLIWTLSRNFRNFYYLQFKRDFTTINTSNLSAHPYLTVINDGFGFKEKLLGGYLTPLSVQVKEEVKAATRILRGESPADIPITESAKAYVMDWNAIKHFNIPLQKIPAECEILHMPFREKHFALWLTLIITGCGAVVLLIVCLTFLYRREEQRKRKALYALEDEKETLALAIESGNTFAWKLENSTFVFESDFCETLGIRQRKLSIDEFAELTHPDYRSRIRQDWPNMPLAQNQKILLQCDFNGTGYQWWEFRYTTLLMSDGQCRTTGLLLNIQEVKDREQELEEARRIAEKAELKESFLANMSHEIRTPLNAIVGFSNILASDEDLTREDKQDFIETINENSELLLKLINDILELSRIESGYMSFKYEDCQVSALVNSTYITHQMLIPPQLEFIKEEDTSGKELLINVDSGRLTQVLTNFLNNACKFTRSGFIKLGYRYLPGENAVCIYVQDSGKGISKEEQTVIFNRFYKQNEFSQGAGLGLSICKVIVSKLGGRIELESEPGKGSRFSIILPLV